MPVRPSMRARARLLLVCALLLALFAAACGDDGGEDEAEFGGIEPLAAPAAGEGFQLEVRAVAPPGIACIIGVSTSR